MEEPQINLRKYQPNKLGRKYLLRILIYVMSFATLIYFVKREMNKAPNKTHHQRFEEKGDTLIQLHPEIETP